MAWGISRAVVAARTKIGDDAERVGAIELSQGRIGDAAELEACEDAAGAQDAMGFSQDAIDVRAVADAKGDRVEVDRIVRHVVQSLGVALRERDLRATVVHAASEAPSPLLQHVRVDVDHMHSHVPIRVPQSAMVEQALRNVPRPAGDVKTAHAAARIQQAHEAVLPEAMDAQRHGVVHHIVCAIQRRIQRRALTRRSHAAEDTSDWPVRLRSSP